jgi:hypothetical protein
VTSLRYDLRSSRTAIMLAMLGDCVSIATLCCDRVSERSYLFTMSNIALAHQTTRLERWRMTFFADECEFSAGGARRNRTDDLLLAKQALSQLSYGPSRYRGSEASIREERARR